MLRVAVTGGRGLRETFKGARESFVLCNVALVGGESVFILLHNRTSFTNTREYNNRELPRRRGKVNFFERKCLPSTPRPPAHPHPEPRCHLFFSVFHIHFHFKSLALERIFCFRSRLFESEFKAIWEETFRFTEKEENVKKTFAFHKRLNSHCRRRPHFLLQKISLNIRRIRSTVV